MNLDKIRIKLAQLAKARNWDQYHTPKISRWHLLPKLANSSKSFSGLLNEKSKEIVHDGKEMAQIRQEIAAVFIYPVRLADKLNVGIEQAVLDKIEGNEKK